MDRYADGGNNVENCEEKGLFGQGLKLDFYILFMQECTDSRFTTKSF